MNIKPRVARPDKTVNIGGMRFTYKTSRGLIKKIWSEATSISKSIRNLDQRRETLLKAYRDLHWKQQLNWCERNGLDKK